MMSYVKMEYVTAIICILVMATSLCKSDNEQPAGTIVTTSPADPVDYDEVIEGGISNIETTSMTAERLSREGILPLEEAEKLYIAMIDTLEDIIELVKTPTNAYKFLKAKGIERTFISNISINYPKLRELLLILIKVLFEVAPTTTKAVIPITVIDKVLDIFENDDNLGIKAHALDILYVWLPENPKAQVRVMKLKGLEPFYHQILKLDNSAIAILLDLFNNILKEHIKIRNDVQQKSKIDSDRYILYQRIGLIERMSTPTVCNGLVNIFEDMFLFGTVDKNVIGPAFELVKNMKPYCVKILKGQNRASELFETMLKHVQDEYKMNQYGTANINVTELKSILEDYVRELKHEYSVKDEF